jgi:integrase
MPQQPLDDDVADFLDDSDWTAAVKINATSILNRWTRWCGDHATTVLDADRKTLRAYLAERQAAEIAASTRKKDWQVITALYTWAATPTRQRGGGLLTDNPMASVRPPAVPSRPQTRAAKPADVEALEDYFAELVRRRPEHAERARRDAAMISLMWRSGLRVGELPWIDVDDITEHHSGQWLIRLRGEHTKSDEARLVPVHPQTRRLLERYLRKRTRMPGPLFLGRAAHTRDPDLRLTVRAIRGVVARAAKATGVPLSSHQLRRGWTSQFLRQSHGDVLTLEIVGGWADHRMPRRYLADEEADAAIDRFFDVADATNDHAKGAALRAVR